MGFSDYVYIGPYAKFPHQKEEVDDGQEISCTNKECKDFDKKERVSIHSDDFDKRVFCHSCGEKLDVKPAKRECVLMVCEVLENLGMDYDEAEDRFHDISNHACVNLDHYFLAPNINYGFDRGTHINASEDSVRYDMDGDQIAKEIEGFKKEYEKELTLLRNKFGDKLEIKFGVITFPW